MNRETPRPRVRSEEHGAEPVLVTHADRCYGAVVELEGRAPVHHQAGVPAAGAHAHPRRGAQTQHKSQGRVILLLLRNPTP